MMTQPAPLESPVYVARPIMPPLDEYVAELQDVWNVAWLTNAGAKHAALEEALSAFLRAPHLSLFANGTIALQVAVRALELKGEVITTPFTFPATPHALSLAGIDPVFADIDPQSLTLDPARVEALITPRTTGILGVHVYGLPCDVVGIQKLADTYGLKVVYDGAHAFGAELESRPITEWGDATMLSFHATKLFHTAEGGALVVPTLEAKKHIDLLKNFGIRNEVEVDLAGLNGKMNELQAALGLVVLRYVEDERRKRLEIAEIYRSRLQRIESLHPVCTPANVRDSAQYFVIRVSRDGPHDRDSLYEALKAFNVYSRRYFYPLCSEYAFYRDRPSAATQNLPVAHKVAKEVLALPYFSALGPDGANRVCDIIEYLMIGA